MTTLSGPRSRLRSTLALARDEIATLARWHQRYGDIYEVATLAYDTVAVNTPELAKIMFTGDPELFGSFLEGAARPVVGEHSVLLQTGPTHARQRRLLSPPFNNRRAMRGLAETIGGICHRRVESLTPGHELRALELGYEIALETIVRVVYGIVDDDGVKRHCQEVRDGLAAMHPTFLWVPQLQRSWFGPYRRFTTTMGRWMASLRTVVDERRRAGDADQRDDILSLMLTAQTADDQPLSDDEVVDQLRTLLFAGHETTAHSFAWAMEALHHHPDELARVRNEIDALELGADGRLEPKSVLELPYLNAVCDEVLRMHPVLAFVGRTLKKPWSFAGHPLPSGMAIGVAVSEIHNDPTIFAQPQRFSPTRFIERKFGPFEYMPFGGGHRRCIGAALAHSELRLALATCLRMLEFERCGPRPSRTKRLNATFGPDDGVPLRVVARRSPPGTHSAATGSDRGARASSLRPPG